MMPCGGLVKAGSTRNQIKASAPTAFAVGTAYLSHPQGRSNVRVEIDRGILGNTVLPDLKMKVRTGGPSRAAYGGDWRPRLYRITLVHIHLAARGVQCGESIAVVDHQVIPAFRVKAVSVTVPSAAASTGVPRSAGMSIPLWTVFPCPPGFHLAPKGLLRLMVLLPSTGH